MEDEENRLALIHAMLHTSPRREERWVDQQQQDGQRERSLWPPTREQVLWTVGIVALLTVIILIGYRYDITLWDWIKLLIVPAVIAGGGLWFNRQQREGELEIAERRTQDEALQAYLDQMGQLLLDKDRPLRQSKEDDEVRTLARARTLTLLSRLDRTRKRSAVQFLYESGLVDTERRIVDLTGADLSRANLSDADGITNEVLAQQAKSLKDATMPNGQKYEDWLKSKDRGEDGENE
jgi:hypothetical protein